MTITAAADGSALGNPGPAGWAWYIDDDRWAAGGWPHGTNNMGELKAVLELFRATAGVDDDLLVLCDSQYVINSVVKWMPGWKRKGWRKADGAPVMNVELMKDIDAALQGRRYRFEWVKGHVGHELNEAADERARGAATAYQRGSTRCRRAPASASRPHPRHDGPLPRARSARPRAPPRPPCSTSPTPGAGNRPRGASLSSSQRTSGRGSSAGHGGPASARPSFSGSSRPAPEAPPMRSLTRTTTGCRPSPQKPALGGREVATHRGDRPRVATSGPRRRAWRARSGNPPDRPPASCHFWPFQARLEGEKWQPTPWESTTTRA